MAQLITSEYRSQPLTISD